MSNSHEILVQSSNNTQNTNKPQLYNFVAGTKSWCESSIEKRWPWKTAVCTIWWGCWISCGKPWGWCVSANPSHRWACFTENDLISK